MEAAGVEPASANGSVQASTCVLPCRIRHRARPGHRRPGASYREISSSAGQRRPKTSPNCRRLSESHRADFPGDGPRQGSTLRSHRHVVVGVCQVPGWISEIPGISARSLNLAKHVETVTPPSLQSPVVLAPASVSARRVPASWYRGRHCRFPGDPARRPLPGAVAFERLPHVVERFCPEERLPELAARG